MKRFFFLLAAAAVFAIEPHAAHALSACGPRKEVVAYLGQAFGEVPLSIALTDFGSLLEVLVSPHGTWTMIVTTPRGQACVMASGQHWQVLDTRDRPST